MIRGEFARSRFATVGGRLALFKEVGLRDYWCAYWTESHIRALLSSSTSDAIGELGSALNKWLPRGSRVLEAGCGPGHLVRALRQLGYVADGIDYQVAVVQRAKSLLPDLPILVGDVRSLPVKNGAYDGYVCIGVVEHDQEGPIRALREARRVLRTGGLGFFGVPHLTRRRQKLLRLAGPPEEVGQGLEFYQFYFRPRDFQDLLAQASFDLLELRFYGVYAGITRDYQLAAYLHKHGFFSWRVKRGFQALCSRTPRFLASQLAHMALYVAEAL